jgi:antitoxin component YwqK of YwqJK toxin-antitoxin module
MKFSIIIGCFFLFPFISVSQDTLRCGKEIRWNKQTQKFWLNDGSEKIYTGFAICEDGSITNHGFIKEGVWDGKVWAFKNGKQYGVKQYQNGVQHGETMIYDEHFRIIEYHRFENGKITYSLNRIFYQKSNYIKIKEYFPVGDSIRELNVTHFYKNDSLIYKVELIRKIGRKKNGFNDVYFIKNKTNDEILATLLEVYVFNPKDQKKDSYVQLIDRKWFENGKYTKRIEYFQDYYSVFSIKNRRKHGICFDFLYDNKIFMKSEYRKGHFVRIIG